MFKLLGRSEERPWTATADLTAAKTGTDATSARLILHMQENRSTLSPTARMMFTAVAAMMMATALGPLMRGYWPTALFMLVAIAALVFALERHSASRPATETLELSDGRLRLYNSEGRQLDWCAFWVRLAAESRAPTDLRLYLRARDSVVEIGRCLSLDERREVAPLLAAVLAQARGG